MKFQGKAENVATRIIEAFKAGTIPKALSQVFIHRADESPCRKWSWGNQLLVALSGATDARGFRQWQEVKRSVRKGEKAFYILAPCTKKIRDKETEEERVIVVGFRGVPVFGVEQTDGEPLPVDVENERFLDGLPLRQVADHWGLSVESYTGEGGRALGWYQHGKAIALGVKNLSTWAHELCHAADDRLGELKGSTKEIREVVAEFAGATLLECLGQETDADLGGAWEYILSHSGRQQGRAVQNCLKVVERVANTVALILDTAETLRKAA